MNEIKLVSALFKKVHKILLHMFKIAVGFSSDISALPDIDSDIAETF